MMRRFVAALLMITLSGCTTNLQPGVCAAIGGAAAGAIGGFGGSRIQDHQGERGDPAVIAVGALGGMILGGIAGYLICTPPPPPPPPPPAAAAPPPAAPPPPPPALQTGEKLLTLHGPNFDFDKATLTPEARRLLDDVAVKLKANPGAKVGIEGHTDAMGSEPYNERLSLARANAVREYLISAGVPGSQIADVRGYGESKPIASNDTEEGRAENRRVEIIVR
jgi:OOP family OmpA-OmpF porin